MSTWRDAARHEPSEKCTSKSRDAAAHRRGRPSLRRAGWGRALASTWRAWSPQTPQMRRKTAPLLGMSRTGPPAASGRLAGGPATPQQVAVLTNTSALLFTVALCLTTKKVETTPMSVSCGVVNGRPACVDERHQARKAGRHGRTAAWTNTVSHKGHRRLRRPRLHWHSACSPGPSVGTVSPWLPVAGAGRPGHRRAAAKSGGISFGEGH